MYRRHYLYINLYIIIIRNLSPYIFTIYYFKHKKPENLETTVHKLI